MKVPPKRKGNLLAGLPVSPGFADTLNESPSEKEGKYATPAPYIPKPKSLNESPSEKEGKSAEADTETPSNSYPQ